MIGLTYDLTRFAVLAAMHLSRWMIEADLVEEGTYKKLSDACVNIQSAFLDLNAHLKALPRDRLQA